jgi:hypothetical protein
MQSASGSVGYEGESQDINKLKSDLHEKVPGFWWLQFSPLLRHLLCQCREVTSHAFVLPVPPHIFFKSYAQEWAADGTASHCASR